MIKVIEVSSDSNIGGAGKCILTFLKNFDRETFDVSAVIPKGSLLKPEMDDCRIKVFEVEHLAEKSLDFHAISRLRKLFRYLKPDLVHTHASMSARIAAKSLGIPVVYTRHSVFPPPKKLTTFPGKQISGLINNLTADKIIAVAEAAKENLTDTGVDEKKIQVILNGVEALPPCPEEAIGKIRMQYHIRPDEKVAAIIARLNPVKGHKYFIEAAKLVKDAGIRCKFLIAGTGETENALKTQVREAGLEDTVIFLGFLQDVSPLMHLMDVQVNCSYGTEATSLSLLEGMSLGKPAVVSDFGGNPGVIFDGVNGFLTPTHDPYAVADGIKKLLTDQTLYDTMADNCKKIYAAKFTAEINTRAVEQVYREAVMQKRRKKGEKIDETKI